MDSVLYNTACDGFAYDEDKLELLVKYDNNLISVQQLLKPDCITIVNSQFLVAYRNAYDNAGDPLLKSALFQIRYDNIPKCFGLMDTSAVRAVGADQVQALPGLSLTGRDVLIGFVDTGIDFANPLFLRPDGTTRVTAIWDQTEAAYRDNREETTAVFGYGREYTEPVLSAAIRSGQPYNEVPCRDEEGHGTFLASVAAGNVYLDDAESFSGVAPEAEIVMVKLKQASRRLREFYLIADDVPCYSEADIMLGVKYLINKALELRKPLVICLGIGTSQGDHNGNLNLELYLDTIVTLPGICVVASAGNELGSGGHFSSNASYSLNNQNNSLQTRARLVRDETEIFVGADHPGFCMELWGRAPSLYQVAIVSPTGERFERLVPNQDNYGLITFLYEGTMLYAENIVVENNSGDPLVLLRFERPTAGIWKVEVAESYNSFPAGYDAWLPIRWFLRGDIRFTRPDPEVILCAPANARGTITVAGYNHRDNSMYQESSRGYTRKGRIQPDFAAPAVEVYGAFAGGSGTRPLFARRSGTSVAAAFAAGAAALLLEWGIVQGNRYSLNTEMIRQLLIRGTKPVVDTVYPNPSWGWGVLDLARAFELLRSGSGH